MTWSENALLIGDERIAYEIRRSPRRRTLAIEVHADLRVIVRAPERTDARRITECVAERSRWISRTLERLRHNGHQAAPPLRYLAGEMHHYLGEPYTLRVTAGPQSGATMAGGEIRVGLRGQLTPERTRRVLEAWYRERALAVTGEILARQFAYFHNRGHRPPSVSIRRMRTRWGSLAGKRRMTLNLALVRAPLECLEYVVVHELCHLEHRGHGREFHQLMDALMPDWRERKRRLQAALARYR